MSEEEVYEKIQEFLSEVASWRSLSVEEYQSALRMLIEEARTALEASQ